MSVSVVALEQRTTAISEPAAERFGTFGVESLIRKLPIRWRIFLIAALNTAVAIILAALIWRGAESLSAAWTDLRQVRESDPLLAPLGSQAGRPPDPIHPL